MKRLLKDVFAPILALLFLFSCGYSEDRPSQDFDYYNSEWLFPCVLRGEQLSSLLEKDITEDLNCLKKRLKTYNLYTKRNEGQDVIARPTLEAFVQEYFPEQRDVLKPQIHLMFELNSLLFDQSEEYVTSANLDHFFDIIVVLNREVVAIKQIFSEHTRQKAMATVESNRNITEKFRQAHQRIKEGILPLLNASGERSPPAQGPSSLEPLRESPRGLELRAFFDRIQALFPVYFNSSIEQQLNGLLGIKKLLLGGNEELITSSELSTFIDKIPGIATTVFESYLATQGPTLDGPTSPYPAYLSTLKQLASLFHHQADEEAIFEQNDLSRLIEAIFSESPKLAFYQKWPLSIKSHLIDGVLKNQTYTVKDIRTLFKLGEIALHALQFWHEIEPTRRALVNKTNFSVEERKVMQEILLNKSEQLAGNLKNMEMKEADLFTPSMEFGDFIAAQTQNEEAWKSLASFSKRFLLGGSFEYVNFYELQKLWDKLPILTELFFNLYTSDFSRWTQSEFHQRMFQTTQTLKNLMHSKHHPQEPLLNDRDFASWLNLRLPSLDLTPFLSTARKIKKRWPGGHPEYYTTNEIITILDSAQNFWGHLWFSGTAYKLYQNQETIEMGQLKNNPWPEFPLENWVPKFNQYVENYHRYNSAPSESGEESGDESALIQIAATSWAIDKLAGIFGHRQDASSKYAWDMDTMTTMLETFQDVLIHQGIDQKALPKLAVSNLLFADLFQFHSNGDFHMDTNEAKELGTLALTSFRLENLFTEDLKESCPPSHEDQSSDAFTYQATCVKTHFFDILLENIQDQYHSEGLPRYVDRTPVEEQQLFLQSLENFLFEEKIEQFTGTQIALLLQVVLGIEATYARYDNDNNNFLDAAELETSFQTHQNAIINLAELEDDDTKYAETIYLYVLKNGIFPTGKKTTIWWCHRIRHLCGLNGLSITRNHIALVLDNLLNDEGGLQNKMLGQDPVPPQAQETQDTEEPEKSQKNPRVAKGPKQRKN